MEKIGFVGTGAMGSALLSRLKLANVPATAFDIAPAAMEAARKEGAQTATFANIDLGVNVYLTTAWNVAVTGLVFE